MNLPVIVATALVASIVAGGLLWGGIALLLRLRHFDATTRHALWFTSLIVIALLPLAGITASVVHAVRVPSASEPAPLTATSTRTSAVVHGTTTARQPATAAHPRAATHQNVSSDRIAATTPSRPSLNALNGIAGGSLVLLALIALVALAGLIGLGISIRRIGAVKQRSSPLDETLSHDLPWLTETHRGRETYLRLSYEIETPVAIGFGRPVILIPTELATKSGLTAIEDLVIHEHAHLCRYDDYTNLVQRSIERIFWFNPFVWIIGRRIALEREMAADDAVVERTADRTKYADALWRLAREMRMPAHTLVAPGALFTRKQISMRIEALLAPGRAQLRHLGPVSAACAAAVVLVSCAIVALAAPPLEVPAPPAAPSIAAIHAAPAAPPALPKRATPVTVHPPVALHPKAPLVPERPRARHIVETTEVHINAPGVKVDVPPTTPRVHVEAPAVRVAAPTSVSVPKIAVRVPETEVHVPAIDIDVPGVKVRVPPVAVRVPAVRANVPSNELAAALDNAKDSSNTSLTRTLISRCVGCDLSGRDLRNFDLHGLELSGVNLSKADLRGANLRGATLTGADLSNANLDGADLTDAHFSGADIAGASFRGAHMNGVRFVGISLQRSNFDNAGVREILSRGCSGCDLSHMDLHGIDLHDIKLVGADFAHTDLSGANLSGAEFSGVSFDHSNLNRADLRNASLTGCSLHGTSMQDARLDGIRLAGTSLGQ